jgi:alpha-N-arabinofuranosidase
MNVINRFLCFSSLLIVFSGGSAQTTARFGYFSYKGNDKRFDKVLDTYNQYFNPILAGFYPDPSVCRKGDNYYLVTSSFAYYPGVPVFTSKDLVNWKQIGHALNRDSQLKLHHHSVSEGIFAPSISYNERNSTFYLVTMNMGERQVFYVKTKDPFAGWSEPVQLRAGGMDPSFFFDNDGKAYLVYTTMPSGGQNYEGEMSIHAHRFNVENDSVYGESVELVRGGSNIALKPQWIEGPHLYRVGKYCYLICAEGGTQNEHSEVVFRSENPLGPYESYSGNPILTQSGLDFREDAVTSTGHANLIQTPKGDWWAVFLGCRPYEGDLYNTGRDTYLLPVTWKNGWLHILDKGKPIPAIVNKPNLHQTDNQLTGNFSFTDRFEKKALDMGWIFLRNPIPGFYSFDNGNGIIINALPVNIRQKKSISSIFRRQQHTTFVAETEVDFTPLTENDLAGITVFQNEEYNFVFGKTILDGKLSIVLSRTEKETVVTGSTALADNEMHQPLKLRISGDGRYYSFSYTVGEAPWRIMLQDVDAANLSTNRAGGFVGTVIGLYATSNK